MAEGYIENSGKYPRTTTSLVLSGINTNFGIIEKPNEFVKTGKIKRLLSIGQPAVDVDYTLTVSTTGAVYYDFPASVINTIRAYPTYAIVNWTY